MYCIKEFLEPFKGEEIYVGGDVHKRSYSVAVVGCDGACETWTAPADPRKLRLVIAFHKHGEDIRDAR